MHDLFQLLPAPILLMVIKSMPDLQSLYLLVQASTIAAGIFEDCPSEIVETVLSHLPEELRQIIYAVAIALTDSSTHLMTVCRPITTYFSRFPLVKRAGYHFLQGFRP